jgi:hypothetical protein
VILFLGNLLFQTVLKKYLKKKMLNLLQLYTFSLVTGNMYPLGTYYGKVRLVILPTQEIFVHTNKPNTGQLELRGAVNYKENFEYKIIKDNYVMYFNDGIKNILKKYKTSITKLCYYSGEDVAEIFLKLPIIGNTCIKLKKITL